MAEEAALAMDDKLGAVAGVDAVGTAGALGTAEAFVEDAALIAFCAVVPLAPAVATSLPPCARARETGISSADDVSLSADACQARYKANIEKAAAKPAIRSGRCRTR
ncbi:hypothetical protein [Trinickia soli]|uniref:hypothetical protein n=1 Tax=Trinickia soli TaxID=380675 RepID=UPI003FA3466A